MFNEVERISDARVFVIVWAALNDQYRYASFGKSSSDDASSGSTWAHVSAMLIETNSQ